MVKLLEWPRQKATTVAELQGDPEIVRRLQDLGFLPGVEVTLVGRAPFQGPFLVRVQSGTVAMRQTEIECILVREN